MDNNLPKPAKPELHRPRSSCTIPFWIRRERSWRDGAGSSFAKRLVRKWPVSDFSSTGGDALSDQPPTTNRRRIPGRRYPYEGPTVHVKNHEFDQHLTRKHRVNVRVLNLTIPDEIEIYRAVLEKVSNREAVFVNGRPYEFVEQGIPKVVLRWSDPYDTYTGPDVP